ncbi:MAG TPA: hypothetical protein VMT88_10835, partial [Actinomycetes bacterium]|nr:hypothetical protein [Actinomycetes bacterium]
ETDGKLQLLRKYPPMLYVDAHEFGSQNFLFPPTADPEYHETPDIAHDWIFDEYSPAIATEFDREGLHYHHGAPYDFFASIFGDTVPTVGFHAAGMTFEKDTADRTEDRVHQQFIAMWASLFAGATDARQRVADWHDSYVEAYQEGLAGTLEPNEVFEPKHTVFQQVPDQLVRSYFLLNDTNRQSEIQLLVRRLQRMDVDVYQLSHPLDVGDYHAYAEDGAPKTLPKGTYWIPMAQGQKHWIQAMLQEDSYIPYPVTYDVTAWSNPLLMNLRGGWTGDELTPQAQLVDNVGAVDPPRVPANLPSVGLFEIPNSSRGFESAGQTRYLFDQVWHLPYSKVSTREIVNGLRGIDVLVVPDGYTNYALQALGSKGKRALRQWVNDGGRYIGWQGGTEVAARVGLTTAKLGASHTNAPGSLVRVAVDPASPLADGIGRSVWVMYSDDDKMTSSDAVGHFPDVSSPQFGVSGLAEGMGHLAGSAFMADEAVGRGRTIVFSIDPNFRAWTQGTQRLLWNAITDDSSAGNRAATVGSLARQEAVRSARQAAAQLPQLGTPIRLGVSRADAAVTAALLRSHGAHWVRQRTLGATEFLVANRKDLSMEEHPFAATLLVELRAAGVQLRWATMP